MYLFTSQFYDNAQINPLKKPQRIVNIIYFYRVKTKLSSVIENVLV